MCNIQMIDEYLSQLAPTRLSESWDNDGVMVCGDKNKSVGKVLVCLEVTDKALAYAVDNSFDLIITHHPYIFRKLSRVCSGDYKNLETMMKNGISVLSYHTRLDSADGGVNDVLAETLGLENIVPFGGETENIGRMGSLEKEMTQNEFAYLLKEKLGCDIRCAVNEEKTVKSVAVVGGAGKDYIFDGISMGADAFVTSEVPHHLFIAARKIGFGLYDCGHYYTENPVCEKIAKLVKEKFDGIEVQVFDVKCPYTCIQ